MNKAFKMTINERFQQLASKLGAAVITITEYGSLCNGSLPLSAGGGYDSTRDVIIMPAVTDAQFLYMPPQQDHNLTLLHEIVHWSGHLNRASRSAISMGCMFPTDRDTEEATAQLGAQMLAEVMDYKVEQCQKQTDEYVASFPYADLIKAKSDAQEAVSWILNQVGGSI